MIFPHNGILFIHKEKWEYSLSTDNKWSPRCKAVCLVHHPLFFKEKVGRIYLPLYLWKGMLWLIGNKEWQQEFKILSYYWQCSYQRMRLRHESTVGFPISNPRSKQSHLPKWGPHQPLHVGSSPVHFPTWNCRAKSLHWSHLGSQNKGKEGKDWAPHLHQFFSKTHQSCNSLHSEGWRKW